MGIDTKDLPPGYFTVSRRELYRQMAEQPEWQAMAKWGERIYQAQRENHDPGDEDPQR